MALTRTPRAITPVHWGAPLRRAEGFSYTEVGGTPVIVDPVDQAIQPLPPLWASIWASLDGSPVADALEVDVAAMKPVDARNLLEVLRRMKAIGVIADVDPQDRSGSGPAVSAQVDLDRAIDVTVRGSTTRSDRVTTLLIDPAGTNHVTVRVRGTASGIHLGTRSWLRRRVIDRVEVAAALRSSFTDATVDRLAAIVEAVDDARVFTTPGVVDLLAGIAERATAPVSPTL